MLYMYGSVVYRCVEIHCCYGSASLSCKLLAGVTYFIVVCVSPFGWDYSKIFLTPWDYSLWRVLEDEVFSHPPCKLVESHAVIGTDFETLHATPDFTSHVCYIFRKRCLACIAEGGS